MADGATFRITNPHSGASTSFSGCDITAFGNVGGQLFQIGFLSSLSVTTTRQKGLTYIMGRTDPIGVARGKRASSGTLTAITFDKSMLIAYTVAAMKAYLEANSSIGGANGIIGYTSWYNEPYILERPTIGDTGKYFIDGDIQGYQNTTTENAYLRMQSDLEAGGVGYAGITAQNYENWVNYADQLHPFDIHVIAANENGAKAHFFIYGVEFTSEAIATGINDILIEQPYNFICRGMSRMTPGFGTRWNGNAAQNIASASVGASATGIVNYPY